MNSITDLLDLEDSDINISDIIVEGQTKTLIIETPPVAHYCPTCGYRMHSRGVKKKTINHPILQDGYSLILLLKQRRWRCSNPDCLYEVNEAFRFVNKGRRTTNATDLLIVETYRNLLETSASIAKRFHMSDSYVHEVFDRYVKLDRLSLTDAISIDEVHLDMDDDCKYALVIQDFHTGDPIDLLRSRRTSVTEPYFVSIPATASIYDVSYSQVYSWVKKYDAQGEVGLTDKRGHHKADEEVDELERLRRENIRLKRQLQEKDMLAELLKKVQEFERM